MCIVKLCQVEGGHNSNSGSLASQGSQEDGSLHSGRDSERPSFLESSLDLSASGDRISFARAAVSPVLSLNIVTFSRVFLTSKFNVCELTFLLICCFIFICFCILVSAHTVAKYCDEYVYMSVCRQGYLQNHVCNLCQIFCACCLCLCLGPPPAY